MKAMAKKKGKPLKKRQREFEMLKPFGHDVLQFNDCFMIRVLASNGETVDYYPVSEKFKRKGSRLFQIGYGELIEYLIRVS